MPHTLHIARSPAFYDDDTPDNPLARFASSGAFVAPQACDQTNHCARCVNADTAHCGACIAEARWRDGGLRHFQPISIHAAEPEARAA